MFKFLLSLFLLLGYYSGFTQSGTANVQDKNLIELRRSLEKSDETIPAFNFSRQQLINNSLFASSLQQAPTPNLAVAPIPAAWQYQDLAIFCRLEVKMEKALNLPVKIRLGEVQSVERKEGKLKTFESRE